MQIDQRRARQQYQNKVNNAQGHFFEDYIKAACALYSMRERAEVDKTPEPFRVLEKLRDGIFKGRFTARAQPDFQGTLAGGRSIVFEAKYTTTDLLKWDILTQEQRDALEHHHQHGAISAVCAAADLEPWRVRFNGAVLFLDYAHERSGSNEETAQTEINGSGNTADRL